MPLTTCISGTDLSHCLRVQLAIIHRDTIKTNKTVPGQIVISVFKTNLEKFANILNIINLLIIRTKQILIFNDSLIIAISN